MVECGMIMQDFILYSLFLDLTMFYPLHVKDYTNYYFIINTQDYPRFCREVFGASCNCFELHLEGIRFQNVEGL